ncbi:hypothetical protein, partial [Vibrio sp. F12]|uniref:hypothetical protein n=1 Tax=Vibrio sp. F12 TaxID=2070776 RepID=UPI0019CF892E
VLQGEPIKKSRIIDAAFLYLKMHNFSIQLPSHFKYHIQFKNQPFLYPSKATNLRHLTPFKIVQQQTTHSRKSHS